MKNFKHLYSSLESSDNITEQYFDELLPTLFGLNSKPELLHYGKANYYKGRYDHIKLSISRINFIGTKFQTSTNRFHHFTSLKSIFSILNEASIRMYNLKGFNDPNEFGYFAYNLISKQNVEKYLDNTFVFSMCEENIVGSPRELTQWRLYGNDGRGIAIKLKIDMHKSHNSYHFLGKVNYDLPDLEKFQLKHEKFCTENNIEIYVENCLPIPSLLYKNKLYEIEAENRLVYYTESLNDNYEPVWVKFLDGKIMSDVNSKNEIVKYIKLPFDSKTQDQPGIEIEEIIIGFKLENEFSSIEKELNEIINENIKNHRMVKQPKITLSNLTGTYK